MDQPSDTPVSASEASDRLADLWREAQRAYAYHPFVQIVPIEGNPPTIFQIEYRARTLVVDETGMLGYSPNCFVEVTLPGDFPNAPPHVKPMQSIFHPNVEMESVKIVPEWNAANTLADLVGGIGRLLAFQAYDPEDVWNPVAMQWIIDNPDYVPTDADADLALNAGGDPLERIIRWGGGTLSSLQDQLRKFSASLLDPIALPTAADAARFAERTRLAAGLFLATDIPEALSKKAMEILTWTGALPLAESFLVGFRKVLAAVRSSSALAAGLVETSQPLARHLLAIDQLADAEPPEEPRLLLKKLPLTADVQKATGLLRALLAKVELKFNAAHVGLQSLELASPTASLPAGLQVVLDAELTRRSSAISAARAQLQGAIQNAEPVLERARREAFSLEHIMLWREYADMRERAQRMTRVALDLGAAGVQAYFIANETGKHGPFDFEQEVDLGMAKVALHLVGRHSLEAIDAKRGEVFGRMSGGELAANIPAEPPGDSFLATFHPTPSCDELSLHLEYAVGQTRAMLDRLTTVALPAPATSWSEKYVTSLGRPEVLAAFVADRQATSSTWAALVDDLRALAPLKDRIATYHLLLRALESLPKHTNELAAARSGHGQAEQRLNEILARSTQDTTTGGVIIPAKYHREYTTLLEQSEHFQKQVDRLARAIVGTTAQLKTRLTLSKVGPSPIGSAQPIKLACLPPMPADQGDLSAALGDDVIFSMVAELEGLLGEPIYIGPRPVVANEAPPPSILETMSPEPETEQNEEAQAESDPDNLLVNWPIQPLHLARQLTTDH